MPTVSVIIPNYNHAPYLKERIDSVLNQTFQDFEVIILDDKSTDDSRDVIEQYRGHNKISHIIYNDVNSGSTFKQWDKGIGLAKGEWIWIAESDDFCEPTFLKNVVEPITNNNNIGISYCQSIFYNSEQNSFYPHISIAEISTVIAKNEYLEKKLLPFNQLVNSSMAIFRRELYYKISKEYKNYKLAGDWVFWAEISRLQDIAICGKFLNYFRQHPVKVSFNIKKTGQSYIEELKAIQYFKNELGVNEKIFEEAITRQYMKFRYDKFALNEGIREKTHQLFIDNFTKEVKKNVNKQIIRDKIEFKYGLKLINFFKRKWK